MAGPLDRETVPEYQVIVIARDSAISGNQLEVGRVLSLLVSYYLFYTNNAVNGHSKGCDY